MEVIENFIADQGITFPVLHDNRDVYYQYTIPGGQSPYPRDYIIDAMGILRMTKTEYDPGAMIAIIEDLLSGETTAVDGEPLLPETMRLLPSFPNPFNPATTLQFALPTRRISSLEILDLLGRVVATLFQDAVQEPGHHYIQWNGKDPFGRNLPSGVYIARLRSGGEVHTQKLLMIQ